MTDIVSIDIDDDEQVERLAKAQADGVILGHWDSAPKVSRDRYVAEVRKGLRAFAHPTKPAEPTGLGAVVWDHRRGIAVVRASDSSLPWWCGGWRRKWDDLDVRTEADILSHGIDPNEVNR